MSTTFASIVQVRDDRYRDVSRALRMQSAMLGIARPARDPAWDQYQAVMDDLAAAFGFVNLAEALANSYVIELDPVARRAILRTREVTYGACE